MIDKNRSSNSNINSNVKLNINSNTKKGVSSNLSLSSDKDRNTNSKSDAKNSAAAKYYSNRQTSNASRGSNYENANAKRGTNNGSFKDYKTRNSDYDSNFESSSAKTIFKVITLATVSIVLLSIFIIMSSMLITYFNNMTGKIVYLIELSLLLSNFIAGLFAKNLKEAVLSGILFSVLFYGIICSIAGGMTMTLSMVYLFGIIIISSILGTLVKYYIKEDRRK